MRLIALLFVFILPLSAQAETAPVPGQHPVAETKQELQSKEAEKQALEKDMKSIKGTLKDTRQRAVRLSTKVRKSESTLVALETQIKRNELEKTQIQKRLGEDEKSLGQLVLALSRLGRVPPEAVIMKPGAPLETAQSALVLESTLPRLYGRAEQLKNDLGRLSELIDSLERQKMQAQRTAAQLKKEQAELEGLLQKREKLYARTETNINKTRAEIAQISKRADNLKDLVNKLDRYENRQATPAPRKIPQNPKNLPRLSKLKMPVSGAIQVRFGDKDNIGAPSQGLRIQGRRGGIVTAPLAGTVRYAGPFRNYGQIIIIEHQKGYHSLLAGLGRIDTVEGREIVSGEAVGIMPSERQPQLYYELRYKGKPINPDPFLASS